MRIAALEERQGWQMGLSLALAFILLLLLALWFYHRRAKEQQIAARAAQDAEQAERKRLARDLHDVLDQSIDELSLIAHHLVPNSLSRGLRVALGELCDAIFIAQFHFSGHEEARPDSRLEALLYHCAYELVNNALKHSQAEHIHVDLYLDEALVSLSIQDDGTGFDTQTVTYRSGLDNIRSRIAAYKGQLHLYTALGQSGIVRVSGISHTPAECRHLLSLKQPDILLLDLSLERSDDTAEVLVGIKAVMQGELYLCRGIRQRQKEEESSIHITAREREVLLQIVKGERNKGIAKKLEISVHTVKSHRKSLMSKLEAKNAVDLIKKAKAYGLIH
jgi:DNA-binding NarL/FixJ family response regulator